MSKGALIDLKSQLEAMPISDVKFNLGWDTITLVKVLKYNGRGINLDYYKASTTKEEVTEEAVADTEEAVLVTAGEAE